MTVRLVIVPHELRKRYSTVPYPYGNIYMVVFEVRPLLVTSHKQKQEVS